ncbi:WD40 repeat domain-containing protein [Variovorax sp. J22P240]|uniref:WD40 repeat domain-containing protein n=1 Tax=Variovorax sp. J22P240 TaxID=3053514 RepID=UPI002575C21A|nr:WD40 repeat domain-containing protein [Variovorax sp. J22P240]MDM0002981.1 WD40 repeat domain-containing protein [Variovorax sp. J22P240]
MSESDAVVQAAPFVGLRPFDAQDERWFFGREREIETLTRKLRQSSFTAVVGPSGSGKSSIVRAGAVPKLRAEGWVEIIAKPGFAPFDRLARALAAARVATGDPAAPLAEALRFRYASMMRASAYGLAKIAEDLRPDATHILLIIDQFEELFRYGDEAVDGARAAMREEGRAFVELLLTEAANQKTRIHCCVTMRSDFFGNCSAYAGLAEVVSEAQFLVPFPTRDQLERAIRQPVQLAGAKIEEAVVQRLLVDVEEETDQLPLLQHTLRRLWERSSGNPREIREDDYIKVGRIAGSIENKAESLLAHLCAKNAADGLSVQLAMKVLTDLDARDRATRRPQRRSELLAVITGAPGADALLANSSLNRVLDAFGAEDVSFLQLGAGDDPEVDLGHEALIRGWTKLAGPKRDFTSGWLFEDREDGERWRGYVRDAREGVRLSVAEQHRLKRWRKTHSLSDAWSRRYGGGWDEVALLLRSSRSKSVATSFAISLGVCAALLIIGHPIYRTMEEAALRSQRLTSLTLAVQARDKAEAGDARTGALLARKALPFADPDDPHYTATAETALFDALARPLEFIRLVGHQGAVNSVAFSPDGTRVVSASDDRTLRLWNAATGGPIGEPLSADREGITCAAFSPDGTRIVSASYGGSLRLWDAVEGRLVEELPSGHEGTVNSVAFSPDGTRIVSASNDRTLRLWDAATGRPVGAPLTGHEASVKSAAFSPDGKAIISVSSDGTARLWEYSAVPRVIRTMYLTDAQVGKSRQDVDLDESFALANRPRKQVAVDLQLEVGPISAAFSPDSKTIVFGFSDNSVRLVDTSGLAIGDPMQGHKGRVRAVAFAPDGQRIFSGSSDNTVRVWDFSTRAPIGVALTAHKGELTAVVLSPDGTRLASASEDGTVRLWALGGVKPRGLPLTARQQGVFIGSWSPDGQRIVSAGSDGTLRVWDAATLAPIGEPFRGHTGAAYFAAFSPDGKRIVSASEDRTVRLWDASNGHLIGKPLEHAGGVVYASFSPDGRFLISASSDKTLRIWDATTRRPIGKPLEGHEGEVKTAEFSPDGTKIVSSSYDKTVRLWDARTGAAIGKPFEGHTDQVIGAFFLPDGKRVISAAEDKTLRLWDVATGKQIGRPWRGHTNSVWFAAVSRDGRRVISASSDSTLRIWDVATGQQIGEPLVGHTSAVRGVSLSPDGTVMISASFDDTLRRWDAPSADRRRALSEADKLCPFSVDEATALGLVDPRFPALANERPAERTGCLLGTTVVETNRTARRVRPGTVR